MLQSSNVMIPITDSPRNIPNTIVNDVKQQKEHKRRNGVVVLDKMVSNVEKMVRKKTKEDMVGLGSRLQTKERRIGTTQNEGKSRMEMKKRRERGRFYEIPASGARPCGEKILVVKEIGLNIKEKAL